MKKFWCVDTRFFDSGYVKVLTYEVNSEEKPKNTKVENKLCDQYRDYFDTYKEAKAFAAEAERA